MKVLVTGGAGYIGSHVVYELIEQGYSVVIADNLSTGFYSNIHPLASFYEVDLRSKKDLVYLFEKEKNINAIMHFAGSIVVPESVYKPIEYFDNNVYSVQVLLEVANMFNVKTFIFSSTAAVYGEPQNTPIFEDDSKEPINPYGESKLAAEMLIKSWAKAYGGEYVIFRYFNVAGANKNGLIGIKGNKLTHLVPVVVDAAIEQKTMNIFGTDYQTKDGTCIRDFVHVVDLAQAHIMGLQWSLKNKKSEIFNLGSSTGYSVMEVYKQAKESLGLSINANFSPKRKGDPAILLASTKKVNDILNWKPKFSLDKIIKSEYDFRTNWLFKNKKTN